MGHVEILDSAAFGRAIEPQMTAWLLKVGTRVLAESQRNCNVDTGSLRASLTLTLTGEPSVKIGSPLHYARWVHEGRGPVHPIPPRKFLRFIPKGGSTYVFARSVKAYPGNPFIRNAMHTVMSAL